MTPDITELDEDYEPRGDSNITVNGKLPGNGGDGLWTTDDDGNLVPVDASAVSVEQIDHAGDKQTIYVRADGDDSNSGSSVSDAVRTLEGAKAALTNVPKPQTSGGPTHEIDLEAGETFVLGSQLLFTEPYRPYVRIASDPSNPATIDAQTGSSGGIVVMGAKLELRDVSVNSTANAPGRMLRCLERGMLQLRGDVHVTGGSGRQIDARHNSRVNIMSDAVVDGGGIGEASGVSAHSASFVTMSGTIQNCNDGLYATRNGLASASGTIDNCTRGVSTRDGPQFKLLNTSITNCDVGVSAGRHSQISVINVDFSGTTTRWENRDPTGIINNSDTGQVFFGIGGESRIDFRDEDNNYYMSWFDDWVDMRETPLRVRSQDVRSLNDVDGYVATHDGSGTENTAGPAYNDGSGWVSLIDGSDIS